MVPDVPDAVYWCHYVPDAVYAVGNATIYSAYTATTQYVMHTVYVAQLSIGLGLFGSGSSRAQAWILKNFRALIGPDAGAKSR